jgi:predicted O-linked N-acetylglucosamine transferase (SPINDLY family)
MHRVTLFLYRPDVGLAEQRRAADACAGHIAAGIRTLPARRGASDAMPRLGFLSGDFRTHPAGILVLPTLEALARAGHRFVCYSTSRRADAMTARFRAAASEWRDSAGLADAAVADRIRTDRIDLLFDLSGFTAGQRLAVLAAKPAPVQISWAGYPGTTGLAAIDYLLADAHQLPDEAERFYSEAVIRLPHSYVCHEPPAEAPALAARGPGPILFGSFNALKKITEPALDAWASILASLPESRLLVKATALDCPATRQRFAERLAARGIGGERLLLRGGSSRAAHLAAMGSADIGLDSFPYSGGVTTLECLWMGLPVITMPGESFASRHSLGYLATVGLGELRADSVGSYVDRALALARDADRLGALRAGLRSRLLASPLCDVGQFARHFERACREAWARHRAGAPPGSFSIEG